MKNLELLAPGRQRQALSIAEYDPKSAQRYINLCLSGRFDRSAHAYAREKYFKKKRKS